MATQMSISSIKNAMFKSDVIVAFGLFAILLMMIVPMPAIVLDILLAVNITVSIMILMMSLYSAKALDFGTFPSVLLVTTLFRLSLNIASTRLILLKGNEGPDAAGGVIMSFGQFVVGGNYVVGVVIFVILVVINFMVITKGAGRVAEVSARFTLDAMPGKQMAIDADLNAGMISEQDARKRRQEIMREADFYGAMDGASKFVRGDAIAGIIITLVNIGAGFIIGVAQKGLEMADAASIYTILTVGDGLVGQIPALIISTAAGVLVTRSAGEGDFGNELKTQFSMHPRAVAVVSGLLLIFAVIPGLPHIPFLLLSGVTGYIAYRLHLAEEKKAAEPSGELPEALPQPTEDNYDEMLKIDLLELEVGYGLIPFVDVVQGGELLGRIRNIRKQFALEMGFIVPPVHIKDNLQLKPNEYAILLKGVRIGEGEMLPGHVMAINPGGAMEAVRGVATTEPAFGLPAVWITEDKRERAQIAGFTVVDCSTVMATHISEVIKRHAYELMGRQEAQNLLDNISKSYPKLVEELVPNLLSLGGVMKILQNLLREQVAIRDMRTILETIADWAPSTQDPDLLTEYVRQAMSRSISARYAQDNRMLALITLAPEVEERITAAIHHTGQGSYLALDPRTAQSVLGSISEMVQNFAGGSEPVLLCPPSIRPHVKRLTERYLPSLAVLSHNEIAPHLKIQSLGTVSLNAS